WTVIWYRSLPSGRIEVVTSELERSCSSGSTPCAGLVKVPTWICCAYRSAAVGSLPLPPPPQPATRRTDASAARDAVANPRCRPKTCPCSHRSRRVQPPALALEKTAGAPWKGPRPVTRLCLTRLEREGGQLLSVSVVERLAGGRQPVVDGDVLL